MIMKKTGVAIVMVIFLLILGAVLWKTRGADRANPNGVGLHPRRCRARLPDSVGGSRRTRKAEFRRRSR